MITRAAEAHPTDRETKQVAIADLVALTKPRITLMVLMPTAGGMWLAGHPSTLHVALALLGTGLVIAGANSLNMYLERDIDGRMRRTRDRPLPAGRLRPAIALWMGIALAFVSIPLLAFGVNLLTGALAALSLFLYVLVYTPLKQRSPIALLVGAVPGAMPALMGWTAATGTLQVPGLILFSILWIWQIPHFMAITLFRTQDYAGAGFKIHAAELGAKAVRWRIVAYLVGLIPVTLLLVPAGVEHTFYAVAASLLGAGLLGWALSGLRGEVSERWARGVFIGSLIYLPLLYAAILVGARA